MDEDRRIRALIAEHLSLEAGEVNELAIVDIALALQDIFGVILPITRLGSYADLLRALSDALVARTADLPDGVGSCFVRVRVVAGGADGQVRLVRAGWLTRDLVAALADDLSQAPLGTWVDVLVPPDVTDLEIASIRRGLRGLIETHVQIDVRRIGQPESDPLRRPATAACGETSRANGRGEGSAPGGDRSADGTAVADSFIRPWTHNRRRTEQ